MHKEGKKMLAGLKKSKDLFFTEYSREIAAYQMNAMPGKITDDIGIRPLMKFFGNHSGIGS